MTDIFLSYNREDQARAKLFADAFATEGFDVWWDVGLHTGDAYDQVTEKALRTAKAVVVLWSARSVESRWVRAEATLADRNKTLVPCMIEPCDRPIMFELTQTAELAHWQGDTGDGAWTAFLDDIKRFVAKSAAPAVELPNHILATPTVAETLKPAQRGSAPSLAVLPFKNRSHLPGDEVIAEGMVEDVISALSQGIYVSVLGATATANLRRAAITDLAAVGRQLGVRYLLEGNVRRVGANLRVTAQLLEAATGKVTWMAKFDRPLAELVELQEELVTQIAANLETQVYGLEMERALDKPGNITAWEALARGRSGYRKFDAAALQNGIEQAQRAVTIAPDFAEGHAVLAAANATLYWSASPDDPAEVARIRGIADHALALGPDDATVLSYFGNALCYIGYHEEGERYTGRAVRKVPGSGVMHAHHGQACVMLNQCEAGLSHLSIAEQLMPGSFATWATKAWQSAAYRELGRWVEAEAAIDDVIILMPTLPTVYLTRALIRAKLGQHDAARRQIELARSAGWGWELVRAEMVWRRAAPFSPTLEADIAIIRALYAATKPGA